MTRLALSIAALAVASQTTAQTLRSAADSAAAARSAWATAVRAMRAQDMPTARREVDRAAAAWPTQSTYVWARAVLATRANDTAVAQAALGDYARLGLGRDLSDTTFDRLRPLSWFTAIVAEHDAHRAPLVRSRERAAFTDSTLWPEGVDFDPRTSRFYVASVRHRTVVERTRDGKERELWKRDLPRMGALMGVRVDPRGGILWATMSGIPQMEGYAAADSGLAALLQVRVSDGRILKRWDLPPTARHVLGDLAIGPAGDVFVTDSDSPVLYRLRRGADTLQRITNPLFRSLQGIAPRPEGGVVYVADYSHGMLRVDLGSGAVTRVADAPQSTSLGCDGIAWYRNSIVAVQNGVSPARVMRFHLDSAGTRFIRAEVLDQNVALADEPTIGTVVGNEFVYVANSQWEKFSAAGERNPRIPLARPLLLSVPLTR